jgi:glycosyltransferase involved in cell wall biosynthesis
MNILYLSERDPRNTHFGGAQRTHFIWEALKKVGHVYALHFDQQYRTEEIAPGVWTVRKLMKINALQWFFYRLERKILEPFKVLPLWPMPTYLEKSIDKLFPNVRFDIVVCRYCFDLAEMHLWNFPRVYVDFDDHPLEMYNSVKGRDVHPWLKPVGRFIIKLQMRFLENKITGGWISNPMQASEIHTKEPIVGLRNIALAPSPSYKVDANRKKMLIIVGSMSYYPNYSGADRFLREIWPSVHKKYPDLILCIIGPGLPADYSEKWKRIPNVKEMGFVDNLEAMYQDCLAAVVPIYSGGGTCIKTLESLSYSRVCITSPFGARGLEKCVTSGNKGLQIFHLAKNFLDILDNIILNPFIRQQAEKEAKEYIERNHTQEDFINSLLNTINNEHITEYR